MNKSNKVAAIAASVAIIYSVPVLAAEDSLDDLRQQEETARKAYESARASRLAREISEGERELVLKKAELAKLNGTQLPSEPPTPQPVSVAISSAQAPLTEIAAVASENNLKVTKQTVTEGDKVTSTTSAEPFSQKDLRDGPSTREFGGIKFGVGIAYTLDTGKYQRVREAEVVNNIVRVKQSEQSSARVVLESHYFLTPTWNGLNNLMRTLGVGTNEYLPSKENPDQLEMVSNWGIGPFVALQPGTDNIIDAVGTGVMIGARRAKSGNDSFNLGIGVMVDINARTLGNGIVEDQPLPEGDVIRYKHRSQLGLLLMSSYSF